VVDVRKHYQLISDVGGQLVALTMGNVEQTNQFRESFDAPFTFLADSKQTAYRAYGLARGTLGQIAGPSVWLPSLRALVRGGAGKAVGDVRQMPGSFVVDQAGTVRYAHYPAHQADRPRLDEIVRVLQGPAQM
jgi:peroxiredoxin